MNKRQKMLAAINQHGENLNAIFNTEFDNVTLYRKLFRLERKANKAATCLCNTNTLNLIELNRFTGYDVEQATEEQQEAFFNNILNKVDKILKFRAKNIPVYINYDARGYTLKIKSDFVKNLNIYTDFGDYGILAPDFKN